MFHNLKVNHAFVTYDRGYLTTFSQVFYHCLCIHIRHYAEYVKPYTGHISIDNFPLAARPVEDCRAMSIAMHIFCVLSMACASFLFLRRLHAVYTHNRIIRWIFTFLWIGMTACGIPTLVGFHMEHIPGTGYCTPSKIEEYVSIIDFFPAAFDTLVFFAISYRLFIIHGTAGGRVGWRDFVMGKSLSGLLRVLLHGGQQYYLSVSTIHINSLLPVSILTRLAQIGSSLELQSCQAQSSMLHLPSQTPMVWW